MVTTAAVGPGPRAQTTPEVGPSLALGGDVFPDATVKAWVDRRAERVGEVRAWAELIEEVAPVLSAADLAVVNLETPVSPRRLDDSEPGRPVFNSPPALLEALAWGGVDVVTLANNHAYDQGIEGLRETMEAARRHGLSTVGAGSDVGTECGPVVVRAAAHRVGLCAWTQGSNRRPGLDEERRGPRLAFVRDRTVTRCVAAARTRADLVIASFHFTPGDDWRGPGRYERAAAREAAEAGADLVFGHGPHRPGPTERLTTSDGRSVPVLYSLGNLLGSMGSEARELRSGRAGVRDVPVVVARTRRRAGGGLEVATLAVTPFWTAGAAPRQPWWSPEAPALIRPLSIRAELERIDRARCGAACQDMARRYRRRAELTVAALGLEEDASRSGSAPRALLPAQAASPPSSPRPSEPRAASAPALSAAAGGDLLARLLAGAALPVRFVPGSPRVAEADEAAVRTIVELLLADRSLRVRLTGRAASGAGGLSARSLALRRARAAMWMIAGAGPSRSRFELEATVVEAGSAEEPEVTITLSR